MYLVVVVLQFVGKFRTFAGLPEETLCMRLSIMESRKWCRTFSHARDTQCRPREGIVLVDAYDGNTKSGYCM